MTLRKRFLALPVLVGWLAPAAAIGQVPAYVPLPADLQGELDGVPYRIRVPASWNGTLIVYAHGYAETAVPPALAPLPADVDALLAKGFALAASRFGGIAPMPGTATGLGGYQVKEGMQNTVALTGAFKEKVGPPVRTILWGKSLGGLITLGLIEKFPGLFDGAVALCAAGAGTPHRFDQLLDVALAYKIALGWEPGWGTVGDLRDDLNYMTDVRLHVQARLGPEYEGAWEFLRLVNRLPFDSFYANRIGLPERIQVLYFALAVRAELERRAGGRVAQNAGRVYTLGADETEYLIGLGVDVDGLLSQMNAEANITAAPDARNYASHYVAPAGDVLRPVLTIHTTGDTLAPAFHESAYAANVEEQGGSEMLMQQFTGGFKDAAGNTLNGHCTFTSAQDLAGLDAMTHWLETGQRPEAFFPATLGFLPGFVPAPWPW
jgi:pimeloyl-ACP methyl ester carboxylesterase